MKYDKKFLIIGNQNALTYKEIFPLIKENKLWLGLTMNGSNRWFRVPDDYEQSSSMKVEDGIKYCFVKAVVWFTNLEHHRRKEELILINRYSPEEYPTYDNYDAIEVGNVNKIPYDYEGVMGVPITFLHKYNPNQFEIIWQASGNTYGNAPKSILDDLKFNPNIKYGGGLGAAVLNGKAVYSRILIRNKKPQLS